MNVPSILCCHRPIVNTWTNFVKPVHCKLTENSYQQLYFIGVDFQIKDYQEMDSNALRKPAAKAIFDEFIMPDLLARDHVSTKFRIFNFQISFII